MRLLLSIAAAAALVLASNLSPALAQAPPIPGARPFGAAPAGGLPAAGAPAGVAPVAAAPRSGGSVAVIDLAHIFKNHPRFRASMEGLKKETEGFEGWLRQQRDEVTKLTEKFKDPLFKPGTAEYKKIEEEITRRQSEVNVQMTLKKKELVEREATAYYNVYNEVVYAVQDFCDRQGITLVIRYSRDQIDKDNASSVIQGVNRPVVFQRNLDITDLILKKIDPGMAVTPVIPR